MREDIARALYERRHGIRSPIPWEKADPITRNVMFGDADAVLAVVAPHLDAAETALGKVAEVRDRMKARDVDHRHEDEVGYWGVKGRAYFYAGDIYDDYADLAAALASAEGAKP